MAPPAPPEPGKRRAGHLGTTLQVVLALGLVAAAVLTLTRYVAVPWLVSGVSMSPTLEPGDRVIVDLWTYRRRGPRPGEIALFDGPGGLPLVKRVAEAPPSGSRRPPVAPPAGPDEERWFVVGDNPGASVDSADFGTVPRHRFRGRILFRYWPLSRAGVIR